MLAVVFHQFRGIQISVGPENYQTLFCDCANVGGCFGLETVNKGDMLNGWKFRFNYVWPFCASSER